VVAVFGLLDHPGDDLVPADAFVESHDTLDVHAVARGGGLTPGTETTIQGATGGYLVSARQGGIEIDGQSICVGWHRSLPLRCWICPCCQRDAYKLRQVGGRWACSRCHSLTWASRHTARTIPGLLKLQRLRLRIGANPTPFTSLPTKPKPKTTLCEHLRLMRRIRGLERGLVQHAHNDVAAILEIRLEKRYVRP